MAQLSRKTGHYKATSNSAMLFEELARRWYWKNKDKTVKSQHYSSCLLSRNPNSRKALTCTAQKSSHIQPSGFSLGSELLGRTGELEWGCSSSREAEVFWTWKLFPVEEKWKTKNTPLCQPYQKISLKRDHPNPQLKKRDQRIQSSCDHTITVLCKGIVG